MAADPIDQRIRTIGLEVLGPFERLSQWPGLMEHSALLQDFKLAEVDALGSMMLHVKAQPGQMMIVEGAADDWMMLLLAGTVDVGKRIPEGEREVRGDNTRLAVLRTGAVLGEMSMFDGEPRYASCWALSEVQAAVMDRVGVARLIQTRPEIGAKLLVKLTQLLSQRLRNTSSQLIKVLRQQVV